jgi:hypothetical protein
VKGMRRVESALFGKHSEVRQVERGLWIWSSRLVDAASPCIHDSRTGARAERFAASETNKDVVSCEVRPCPMEFLSSRAVKNSPSLAHSIAD